MSKKLDYLVVGSLGSEAWAYGNYGTKIAKVLEGRREGAKTLLVREEDFSAAFKDAGVIKGCLSHGGAKTLEKATPGRNVLRTASPSRSNAFIQGGLYAGGVLYPWQATRYAVLDLETTGFSPVRDRVIEIAVVALDAQGEIEDEVTTLVNPGRPVAATKIHGLTDADVSEAPRFGEILGHVLKRLAGRIVVAHNADFDGQFLWKECWGTGVPLPAMPALCTMRLSRELDPCARGHKLDDCCRRIGIAVDHRHSALGDCRATAKLLKEWLRRSQPHAAEGLRFPIELPQLPGVQPASSLYPRR